VAALPQLEQKLLLLLQNKFPALVGAAVTAVVVAAEIRPLAAEIRPP
jgi:hypothetical protein